jgi:L,D-transpeptidase-like protein
LVEVEGVARRRLGLLTLDAHVKPGSAYSVLDADFWATGVNHAPIGLAEAAQAAKLSSVGSDARLFCGRANRKRFPKPNQQKFPALRLSLCHRVRPPAPIPATPNSDSIPAPSTTGSLPHAQSSPGSKETGSSVVIGIDKARQRMTVSVDGVQQYEWPVSTGRAGYSPPSGTYTPTSMNEVWYSQEWDNAPMPHAIFIMKDGHAIHGSYEVKTR